MTKAKKSTDTTLTPESMIPPTEPKQVAKDQPPKQQAKGKDPTIRGSTLAPDLERHAAGIALEYTFWIGVTESCPTNHLDMGGVTFPKSMEELIPEPGQPGRVKRIPRFGCFHQIREDQIKSIAQACRLTVMRILPGDKPKGYPVRIPSEEEIEASKARGRACRPYVQQVGDKPAADYLYMVLCTDQSNPVRGEYSPAPLSETGLPWPHEITED